ncbi:MAG: cupin domain-containing protein [Acidobacteria bacterium]|nr:cupin domain-containing protein [Acidobacteriota bacterium]
MFDACVPAQHGPPPHVHHREDESFYVLEGEFEFMVAGETIHARPGDTIYGKRDIPHTFRCVSETTGRMIITVAPAGLENFFAEVGTELAGPDADPVPPAPDEIQRLLAAAPRYGLEILIPG